MQNIHQEAEMSRSTIDKGTIPLITADIFCLP